MGMRVSRAVELKIEELAQRKSRSESAPGRWVMTIIGWHPVSDNELIGVHWGRVSKLKRRDKGRIAGEKLFWQVPEASRPRRVDVRLLSNGKPGDSNNFRKSLLDALVFNGLLVDDSDKWCRADFTVEKGCKATIITLEDVIQ